MADNTLKLEVITPEQIALRDESTSVVVPGVDGELGIWPNHAPLLAGLKPGVIMKEILHRKNALFVEFQQKSLQRRAAKRLGQLNTL